MHLWYTWLYTQIWKVPRQLRTWQEHAQRSSEKRRSWRQELKSQFSQGNTLTFDDRLMIIWWSFDDHLMIMWELASPNDVKVPLDQQLN